MASAVGSHAKTVRVCDPCHRRKVSCDLVRPTCGACSKYQRNRPDHTCTYGPGAAFPGEKKQVREKTRATSTEEDEDVGKEEGVSVETAKTRSRSRALKVDRMGAKGKREETTEPILSEVEESSSSWDDSLDDDKPIRPIPAPLCLPTSFPTFPSTLPALPPLSLHYEPPAAPSPATPATPYFTSVFSPLPSPEILLTSSAPALSPRPSSRGASRRASFPDNEVLLARDFLADAQRGLARLSVSPPLTAGAGGGEAACGGQTTARPLEWEGQFDDVFAWA